MRVVSHPKSSQSQFVYLSCQQLKAVLIFCVAMPSVVWLCKTFVIRSGSPESLSSTKLKLYNTCILLKALYSCECWGVTKRDADKIGALDHWCLLKLAGIKWYYHVQNDEVRWTTKQPPLLDIVQAWHFCLSGHNAWMPDAKILAAFPWRNEGEHETAVILK